MPGNKQRFFPVGATRDVLHKVGLLAGLGILVFSFEPASAAIYFDEDFESPQNLSAWYPDPVGFNPLVTGQASSGAQSMFFDYPSDQVNDPFGGGPSIQRYFNETDHLFGRFYVRVEEGFQVSGNNHTKGPQVWFSKGGMIIMGFVNEGTGLRIGAALYPYDRPDTENQYSSFFVPSGDWIDVEFEILMNTPGQSDGLFRMWAKGDLIIETLNRQLRGPTPTSVLPTGGPAPSDSRPNFMLIFRQNGSVGRMYYDRVAVGDSRIGPVSGAIPPTADTTAPASPRGLQLQ